MLLHFKKIPTLYSIDIQEGKIYQTKNNIKRKISVLESLF